MKIRLLTIDDLSSYKSLRLEALKQVPEAFVSSYEEEINYSQKDWEVGFAKSNIFGAFIEGLLVGSAGFYRLNTQKTKHRGVLFAVYVKPTARGQGMASALVDVIITHAQLQVSQIHLACVTTNLTAVKLYEKHGFKIYGTEPRALKIGDAFFDEYLMVLNLES
jgi:RimJ/RimL family protein N-acetyltransferase